MNIINIVDSFEQINFGIWNAASNTAKELHEKYGCNSEIWYPFSIKNSNHEIHFCTQTKLNNNSTDELLKLIAEKKLSTEKTIIATHGCWRFATRWGLLLKDKGYKWIYTPHGMLEPWSMQQKKLKKWIYYHFVEKKIARFADAVRAVGKPEFENLRHNFPQTTLIPNGIPRVNYQKEKSYETINFLFMARLHHKKGIKNLVDAWKNSKINDNTNFQLHIAGPDNGEFYKIKNAINESQNIQYHGSVYDEDKTKLLNKCHYYVLPSQSEGFPVSVLEAMQAGVIPIITEGCNFPEVFDNQLAIKTTTETKNIERALNDLVQFKNEAYKKRSKDCSNFVNKNYSTEIIAKQQFELFQSLLLK